MLDCNRRANVWATKKKCVRRLADTRHWRLTHIVKTLEVVSYPGKKIVFHSDMHTTIWFPSDTRVSFHVWKRLLYAGSGFWEITPEALLTRSNLPKSLHTAFALYLSWALCLWLCACMCVCIEHLCCMCRSGQEPVAHKLMANYREMKEKSVQLNRHIETSSPSSLILLSSLILTRYLILSYFPPTTLGL